jgi:hypothetical protein
MPYEHCLTIYDGTPESEDLLDMVCSIVKPSRARLTILIIKLVPLTQRLPEYTEGKDTAIDMLVTRAGKFAGKRGVKAASAVRYARALGNAVLSEARTRGIDLIALLAPDIESLLPEAGASSEIITIMRQATCAVMLCKPQAE